MNNLCTCCIFAHQMKIKSFTSCHHCEEFLDRNKTITCTTTPNTNISYRRISTISKQDTMHNRATARSLLQYKLYPTITDIVMSNYPSCPLISDS